MGIHAEPRRKASVRKLADLRISESAGSQEISTGFISRPWVIFAKKLELQGVLSGLYCKRGIVTMTTSTDFETIRSIVQGHAQKSKVRNPVIVAISMSLIAGASFIPFEQNSVPKLVGDRNQNLNVCSDKNLRNWLEGQTADVEVKVLDASILGGITAGTVECEGSRYRYTLGSEEPKRVLKLEKLDP